jgi:hypothetical protein
MAAFMKPRVPTAWRVREPRSGLSRIPFVQRCRLEGAQGPIHGLICDIGILGVYVSLDAVPQAGEVYELSFLLPGGETPVAVQGRVVWRNAHSERRVKDLPPGCGLRFIDLLKQDRDRISAMVRAYTMPFVPPPIQ